MKLEDLFAFAYVKEPLTEHFRDPSQVPPDILMEWFKDAFDYQRAHDGEEIGEFISLQPEEVFSWLEDAARLSWEMKKAML